MASSLVGVTIIERMYPTGATLKYLCKIGRRKAAVFPEPVIELATTSLPDLITGIASCWIGVGLTYSKSLTALSRALLNFKS